MLRIILSNLVPVDQCSNIVSVILVVLYTDSSCAVPRHTAGEREVEEENIQTEEEKWRGIYSTCTHILWINIVHVKLHV